MVVDRRLATGDGVGDSVVVGGGLLCRDVVVDSVEIDERLRSRFKDV